MAVVEKIMTGRISSAALSAEICAAASVSGTLNMAKGTVENDYEKLINKPKINGVELVSDKSFEELGDASLTNFEILEIMKNAGF